MTTKSAPDYREYPNPKTGRLARVEFRDVYGHLIAVSELPSLPGRYEVFRDMRSVREHIFLIDAVDLRRLGNAILAVAGAADEDARDRWVKTLENTE